MIVRIMFLNELMNEWILIVLVLVFILVWKLARLPYVGLMEALWMVVKMEMGNYVAKSFVDGMMLVGVVELNELY